MKLVVRPRDRDTGQPASDRSGEITFAARQFQVTAADESLHEILLGSIERFFIPGAGFPRFKKEGGKFLRDDKGKVILDRFVDLAASPDDVLAAIEDNFAISHVYWTELEPDSIPVLSVWMSLETRFGPPAARVRVRGEAFEIRTFDELAAEINEIAAVIDTTALQRDPLRELQQTVRRTGRWKTRLDDMTVAEFNRAPADEERHMRQQIAAQRDEQPWKEPFDLRNVLEESGLMSRHNLKDRIEYLYYGGLPFSFRTIRKFARIVSGMEERLDFEDGLRSTDSRWENFLSMDG